MASILPIFPNAQGFGCTTVAGRGQTIRHVINLNDAGAGSFRQALIDSAAGGQIVFDISGVIRLNSNLVFQGVNLSIFGQSAPIGGIHLTDFGLILRGNDILCQHIACWLGARSLVAPAGDGARSLHIAGDAGFNTFNVVVDHCSAFYGIDSCLEINSGGGGSVRDCTVQYCFIDHPLYNSIHTSGVHARALHIAATAGNNFSVHHNIISNGDQRNPNVANTGNAEIISNLILNYQKYGLEIKGATMCHAISNLFVQGLDFNGGINPPNVPYPYPIHTEAPLNWLAFLDENMLVRNGQFVPSLSSDQAWLVDANLNRLVSQIIFESNGIEINDPRTLKETLLRSAGSRPLNRSLIERTIIDTLRPDLPTSRVIDSEIQIGYPTVASVLRAYVEPTTPNADSDGDGYTDLEEDMIRKSQALSPRPHRGFHTA